jgi:hypothetical protein
VNVYLYRLSDYSDGAGQMSPYTDFGGARSRHISKGLSLSVISPLGNNSRIVLRILFLSTTTQL